MRHRSGSVHTRSKGFLGTEIDLDETYEWGIEELARTVQEQTRTAGEIVPGGSVADVIARSKSCRETNRHPSRAAEPGLPDRPDARGWHLLHRPERRFRARRTNVVERPRGDHGVPHLARDHECVPRGRAWAPPSNRSGCRQPYDPQHPELGHLDDPADRLGMLDGQRMRAARVLLDTGVHLEKPRLDGTGVWDHDYALRFLRDNMHMDDSFVRFEVNRYLGWLGQAPSYKVGQRVWEQIRRDAQQRDGAAFSVKDFHQRALEIGGVGLDTLRMALLT